MINKYRVSRLRGFLMISAIVILACVGAVSSAELISSNCATSNCSLRVNPYNTLRCLRTTDNEDTYEGRVIDISGAAKLKDLVNSGTQRLKKLAESAKLKFASINQQTTDELFTRYKVGSVSVELNLLESKQFLKWANSVTKAYNKDPDAGDVAMASKLISHDDDDAVAKLLVVASNVERTKDMAKRLEGGLLTNWIVNEWSADDVFTLLKLDKEGVKMFGSPVWSTWTSYLLRLDKENPGQLMLRVLKGYYGDEKLAKILAAWMQDHQTFALANKLEKMQHASWSSSGKNADEVFNLLKLNLDGKEL